MVTFIDNLLNRITMYRLVLYTLMVFVAVAAIFGAIGVLPYGPIAIVFSALILLIVAWAANGIFAKFFKAQPNVESVYITALILSLIITPVLPTDLNGISFLVWAAIWAMASKYIVALKKKHFFNPAAFAVVLTAFTIGQSASWWVGGNLPLLPFVLVGGLLITRKIQRFDLALPFFATALTTIIFTSRVFDPWSTIQKVAVHTPLFFFAFITLTEPLTTPPTRPLRIIYGALVGVLFAPAIHIGQIVSSPELALIAGNIFAYIVSPKEKHVLRLKSKHEVANGIYEMVFAIDRPMRFHPGQYMEWTIGHKAPDNRGNRRYFTVASSPTEADVRLGVRSYENASSFKKALFGMDVGKEVVAGQLAGDFTLPNDQEKKLVFIAGGIGVTPFRSMIKYLSDRSEKRDIVLLYSNRTTKEIAYKEVFDNAAQAIGLKTVYAVTEPGETPPHSNGFAGRIDAQLITKNVPDYRERMFYISGPRAMVTSFEKSLHEMGVSRSEIKTDFFPGFV